MAFVSVVTEMWYDRSLLYLMLMMDNNMPDKWF